MIKDTPTRQVIHRGAELVQRPVLCMALVVSGQAFHGMYVGNYVQAWSVAADLSAQLEIVLVPRAFKRVLSMPSKIYDDLWTAAKAMYKTEPAIADEGEVIIYAPHLTEVSYTYGKLIDEVGYQAQSQHLCHEGQTSQRVGAYAASSSGSRVLLQLRKFARRR
jgi:nickel-dependent lactate racemase